MPVIKNYQRQVQQDTLDRHQRSRRDDFGEAEATAGVGLGRAVAGVGSALIKRGEQMDVSDLNAKLSETNAKLSVDFAEEMRKAEPGDDQVIDRFGQHVDDTLSKLRENVGTMAGAQYFDETQAKIKGHFFKKSFDGQAQLAGVKAQQDYNKTINSQTGALLKDPSSFEMSQSLHETSIQNLFDKKLISKSQLTELRAEGNSKMARSTVKGWIDLDPEHAKKLLEDKVYDEHLTGEQKSSLFRQADMAIEGEGVEAKRRERAQEDLTKKREIQIQNDFLVKMNENSLTSKDILNSALPPFGSGSKQQFLNMIAQSNSRTLKTNNRTYQQLFDRVNLPDGDPNKLTDENELNKFLINGQIDYTALNRLRAGVQGLKTAEGKASQVAYKTLTQQVAKTKIAKPDPMTGIPDPHGVELYQAWLVDFQRTFEEQKSKGVPPYKLLSPAYPEYLGKNIDEYVRSVSKRLSRSAEFAIPAPTDLGDKSRQAGETPSDYLKRIRGK